MFNLLIDKYIPFVKSSIDTFNASHGNCINAECIEPEEFTNDRLKNTDALIIRTRTRIDKDLLRGSRVRFVATATIGFDHIDTAWCEQNGIYWTACPGCNSQAVCDYVEEALNELYGNYLTGKTIGVVGVGNVGSKVVQMAKDKGMIVLANDPLKADKGENNFVDLDAIARNSDIITFHTPLTSFGQYPTYHLCNTDFLSLCKPQALIINAARGGVVDEQALLESGHKCVIDCWEGEPNINQNLLHYPQNLLSSFHIAGYSIEGKMNASRTCIEKLSSFFDLPPIWNEASAQAEKAQMQLGDSEQGWLKRLTEQMHQSHFNFEKARKTYRLR